MTGTVRLGGLDTLRIGAMLLVTWQHAASVLGAYANTQWRGISPGQSGVAIFCAMAGYLACRRHPASLPQWFLRRLRVIFPAYWLVTLAAFAMLLVVPGKPMTIGLFVSQMLGLGYFTHGWELVNVVSWFVSLILLCYALTFCAWISRRPSLFWLVLIAICAMLLVSRQEVALSRHLLAYAVGALMALHWSIVSRRVLLVAVSMALWAGLGAWFDSQFFYAGSSGFLLLLAVLGWVPASAWTSALSTYVYEYFLVHGICLAAIVRLPASPWLTVPVAIAVAAIIAVFLVRFQGVLWRVLFSERSLEGHVR